MEKFIRLRQHRQSVVHRMGGGDPGVTFPQPANHPATGDNRLHHIAKTPGSDRRGAGPPARFAAGQQHIADRQRAVNPQPHGERQRRRCGASTTASYHLAKVSPMPASRYSAGALRMMRGSTSTRKLASSKISKFRACPASLYHTDSGVHAAQVAAIVGMATSGTPRRRASTSRCRAARRRRRQSLPPDRHRRPAPAPPRRVRCSGR